MNYLDAHSYLRTRVEKIVGGRQYWSKRDREALNILLLRPTAPERIALARIEGRTAGREPLDCTETRAVHELALRGLGL